MSITDIATRRGAKLVHANGLDIAYTEVGHGPPLVLLHGAFVSTGPSFAGCPGAHVDHLHRLGERFRVIAPDTRGCGATVHHDGPAGLGVLADDVVALVETLGLERPAIAGFSEGGATATLVAMRRPDLVGALVNHAGFDYFDPNAMAHQSLRPMFGGHPEATHADPEAAAAAFASIGPPMSDTFLTMQADYGEAHGADHWRDYIGQFFDRSAEPAPYSIADLAALTVPTLVLVGDRDPFCPVELANELHQLVEGSELGVVPGAGHEINGLLVDVIADFVERRGGAVPPGR